MYQFDVASDPGVGTVAAGVAFRIENAEVDQLLRQHMNGIVQAEAYPHVEVAELGEAVTVCAARSIALLADQDAGVA
ncbi:hypothetical protein D3C81_1617860 [compost metagenome]